jgi:DNA-binding NarL/FixJ family response regulator
MTEKKIKVLIIDDVKQFRQGLMASMKDFARIDIIGDAENGLEGLRFLNYKTPDVILLDLHMPVMDGDKTLDALKEKFPSIKIIILSFYDESALAANYLARGAHAFVSKGSDIKDLVETICFIHEKDTSADNSKRLVNITNKDGLDVRFKKREIEIMKLMCQGLSTIEIANKLFIVPKTVEAHKNNLYKKTNVHSNTKFLAMMMLNGWQYL